MHSDLTPADALEEMDSAIRVSRAYLAAGESCAEVDPDLLKRWRMALAPLVMREIYAPAAIPQVIPQDTVEKALADAVRLLIAIKRKGQDVRLAPALGGGPTPESRALFDIEANAEEWLNDLAYDHPELAGGWKVTPEYADDRALDTVLRATDGGPRHV